MLGRDDNKPPDPGMPGRGQCGLEKPPESPAVPGHEYSVLRTNLQMQGTAGCHVLGMAVVRSSSSARQARQNGRGTNQFQPLPRYLITRPPSPALSLDLQTILAPFLEKSWTNAGPRRNQQFQRDKAKDSRRDCGSLRRRARRGRGSTGCSDQSRARGGHRDEDRRCCAHRGETRALNRAF